MKVFSTPLKKKPQAMVLPTLLMLVMALVVFTSALVYSGTAGLRFAEKNQDQDQAYYAADAGLAEVANIFTRGNGIEEGQFTYKGKLEASGASYEVLAIVNTALDNKGKGSGKKKDASSYATVHTPDKVEVPPQTVYLRSVGTASDGATTCILGALFTLGAGSFQAGLLANQVNVQNSNFAAYDSSSVLITDAGLDPKDKSKFMRFEAILASRKKAGLQFSFDDQTKVLGSVFLAPGSSASGTDALIGAASIDSSMGMIGNLGKDVELPEVKVPKLAPGSSDGVVGDSLPVEQNTKLIEEPRLSLVVNKDYPYGSLQHACGRENGTYVWELDKSGAATPVGYAAEHIAEGNHTLSLSGERVSFIAYNSSGDASGGTATLDMKPRSVENPGLLEPGSYEKVTINDDHSATLRNGGTFVIKELDIADGSSLALGADAKDAPVTIYVTGKLSAAGENAIVNDTKLPPNMKIYYTGSDPVSIAGGASAYFTLIAKDADISLIGPDPEVATTTPSAEPTPAEPPLDPPATVEPPPNNDDPLPPDTGQTTVVSHNTSFYGALIAKNVTVKNANFYYDVATGGIGEGSDVNTFALLNRHRIK